MTYFVMLWGRFGSLCFLPHDEAIVSKPAFVFVTESDGKVGAWTGHRVGTIYSRLMALAVAPIAQRRKPMRRTYLLFIRNFMSELGWRDSLFTTKVRSHVTHFDHLFSTFLFDLYIQRITRRFATTHVAVDRRQAKRSK